jgi:hypothetical protein
MVTRYHQKHKIHTKAKGQILIFTLIVMAIGMIVISPMLSYLNSSSEMYTHGLIRAMAYYSTDTMMTSILNDIYSGTNVWVQNISSSYNLLNPANGSGYLNSGYNISVSINNSIVAAMPTPESSDDWVYLDPGISTCNTSSCDANLLLGTLAFDSTHSYSVYLVGGSSVQVNWALIDSGDQFCVWDPFICYAPCSYHVGGTMWMEYPTNGSTIPGTTVCGSATSATLPLHFNWSVPESLTGNYTIKFHNGGCWQSEANIFGGCGGNNTRPSFTYFSGTGDPANTWVRVGKQTAGGTVYTYQDYTITATARRDNRDIVSITACIRHNPGSSAWWQEQTVQIASWQITYHY